MDEYWENMILFIKQSIYRFSQRLSPLAKIVFVILSSFSLIFMFTYPINLCFLGIMIFVHIILCKIANLIYDIYKTNNTNEPNNTIHVNEEYYQKNCKTYNFQNCTRHFDMETFARECNAILHKEDIQEWYNTSTTASNESDASLLDQHAITEESTDTNEHYDSIYTHSSENDYADSQMIKESFSIYEEYAIEMLLGGHLRGRAIDNGYIVAFMHECQITNPEKLDYWLLENGYLREPSIQESLARYKVPELKQILTEKGMKISGKKNELIDRLISAMSEQEITSQLNSDNRYFLSPKGIERYYDNIDLAEMHKNYKYNINLEEYFKYREVNGKIRGFNETAYLILKEKIRNDLLEKSNFQKINSCYFLSFSELCEKLEKNDDAIHSMLIKLYIDTNLIVGYRFDKFLIEFNGIDNMCDRLDVCMIFNLHTIQRIVNLSKFYSPNMVDDIYDNIKLQYIIFDKENFKMAINDMLQSAYFNASPYMSIIRQNYRKVCTFILMNEN